MDRRGFISFFNKFFRSGRGESSTVFFGLQVVISYSPNRDIRPGFYKIITDYTKSEGKSQKKLFYQQLREQLLRLVPDIAYGYWDFITDEEAALAEYQQWTGEIQDVFMIESEESTTPEPGTTDSKEKQYLVITQVFLLKTQSSLEPFFTKIEAIPSELYFGRSTFSKLLGAVGQIDFSACTQEALYLMPPGKKGGYTQAEIEGEGWEYLRKV
ncbi:MAG: hypothetical protein V1799_04720 [bacterium]